MKIPLKPIPLLLMPCLLCATAMSDDAPFLDGADAVGVFAIDEDHVERDLVAPHLAPVRIELPATVTPVEFLHRVAVRAADINSDGIVDANDVAAMLASFGPCPEGEPCPADLNRDGFVDEHDLQTLLERMAELDGADVPMPQPMDRLEVGYVLPAPANLLEQIVWQEIDPAAAGERGAAMKQVARIELHSPDAQALRVQMAGIVASGVTVRVYDPAGPAVLGPYSTPRNADENGWWSPTIFGDAIGLELVREANPLEPFEPPVITQVAYFYCGAECHGGPGGTLNCHNDVTCFSTWANAEARAVGAMGFISGGGCFVCTGALLNRTPSDFSPLFMTANHCISTNAEAATLEVRWMYQTATCNGTPPNFNTVPRTDGAIVVKRHTGTDWTLLGLIEPPGASFYLGWSAGSWSSGDAATGVHHPAGSWKRISFGTSAGSSNNVQFCDANGQNCFTANVWNVNYSSGTTQGGSSGSPIMDSERRVRGTLCGGTSGCPNPTITKRYGRMDQAFTNIRYFIWDIASPTVFVNGGFAGDPGNNGNNERGTAANPFNTVHEATFAVIETEEVRITPGNYNEQMTIWRPMTITRGGASGIVRIGAP
jgi:hypothetical protein